ncbi:TetR/AcrR family transcriptional regulator [Kineosporia sp. NBRC 101731]|uniref:TetR/AcrR family transcriptional regulator n=1 Tax=Kineosporia sp. NBRC 101731 TaxID=3032199 RepID=UPI0024A3534D|nr:TetR/AcrR family transcriptional regulator [Kineosporia sp. NBRC 101731]GLY31946.1 putative mycofactocin biosynthesis transcriptional regulator MftR [Kineosporia sp. NBRC 101731]
MSSRPPGRPRQTTHAQIRALALTLFEEHGYDQTSLAGIARAAGISRTTLFSYFPAKRDLLWQEFDDRATRLRAYLADEPPGSMVDVVAGSICVLAQYRADEQEQFTRRLRIMESSEELRAYTTLSTTDLAGEIVTFVLERAPHAGATLISDLTHALMAVAARATQEWATHTDPPGDLDAYVADRLRPLVTALGPGFLGT